MITGITKYCSIGKCINKQFENVKSLKFREVDSYSGENK